MPAFESLLTAHIRFIPLQEKPRDLQSGLRDECDNVQHVFLISLERAEQLDISFWHQAWCSLYLQARANCLKAHLRIID